MAAYGEALPRMVARPLKAFKEKRGRFSEMLREVGRDI